MKRTGADQAIQLETASGESRLPRAASFCFLASWAPYVLAVAIISVLVVSLAAIALWQEKQRYRERASVATQNLSRLLDQHVNDVLDKIDVVLQSTASGYHDQIAKGGPDRARLNAYLARQQVLLPEVLALRILDKEGVVRFGNNVPTENLVNLSERTFFTRSRDDPTGSLVATGIGFAPIDQKWVIALARRLSDVDGNFAGVVYALLPTSHFEKLFSSLALGPHGAATIRTADLALVHRYPDNKNAVGSKNVSNELREHVQASPEGGEYIAATALDDIERSNAYRKLQHYPYYVIVGLATDDYMGGWRNSVLMFAGLAGLTVLATTLAAILVYRSARRQGAEIMQRKRTELALEEHRDHLEATVAERTKEVRRLAAEATYAEERERQALARDLHDDLGQLLHVMGLRLDLLGREALSVNGRSLLGQMSSSITDASRQVRSLTSQLSPPTLATLGLSPALEWLCRDILQTYGLTVDCLAESTNADLAPEQSAILFRAARELLINVAKHSGCDTATLKLTKEGNTLTMAVEDLGRGIQDIEEALAGMRGFGLANVRERITCLGGGMNIQAPAGGGLRVTIQMPLEAATEIHERQS